MDTPVDEESEREREMMREMMRVESSIRGEDRTEKIIKRARRDRKVKCKDGRLISDMT